mmetsp:Transcript_20117/g.42116  ORF Transcript_20117/g.42116 Transcript_20117/m.42116 type:complete len:170 (+) Transcript_20117:430-939(+)
MHVTPATTQDPSSSVKKRLFLVIVAYVLKHSAADIYNTMQFASTSMTGLADRWEFTYFIDIATCTIQLSSPTKANNLAARMLLRGVPTRQERLKYMVGKKERKQQTQVKTTHNRKDGFKVPTLTDRLRSKRKSLQHRAILNVARTHIKMYQEIAHDCHAIGASLLSMGD